MKQLKFNIDSKIKQLFQYAKRQKTYSIRIFRECAVAWKVKKESAVFL